MKKLFLAATALAGLLASGIPHAQDAYPSKPLRIIVPFAPGGGIDILGRTLGQKLSERWKQPVVIETLGRQGLQPTGGTPAELADLTSSDLARWARVIQEANIKAD